jgi:ABC-2 type transport system permease protein
MNIDRIRAIAKKEVMHILRDPFTLGMAIGIPAVMVIFFGFAIDFDFRAIKVAVFDADHSRPSRELARTFSSSGYFIPVAGTDAADPVADVEAERASLALVINHGFARDMGAEQTAHVQVLLDGSDNQKTGIVSGYLAGILTTANNRFAATPIQQPVDLRTRFVYNPDLSTQQFTVPGLIVIVTGLLAILMTALTVAREWERGSMELLLSTPVTPGEIIVGKILPYVALVLGGIAFVFIFSRLVFAVPFEGSFLLFVLACVLFTTTSLAQGILISVLTRQQQKAMQFAMVMGLLPSILLSGFVFPIESMPVFFRYLTMILPPRWFMQIIRALFLKGSSLAELALPFSALLLMTIVFLTAAVKNFKKDVEP